MTIETSTTTDAATEDHSTTTAELSPAPRRNRRRILDYDEAQQVNLRHTAVRPYRAFVNLAVQEELEDNIKRHCRAVKLARTRGIKRPPLVEAANDVLLKLTKSAGASLIAETLLAIEELRRRSPGLFTSTRCALQQRIRLLCHEDKTARYLLQGKKHKLREPPRKVGVELNVILDRLITAAENTVTPPPKARPLIELMIEEEARRGRPLGHEHYDYE